jgi:hypothetical protein
MTDPKSETSLEAKKLSTWLMRMYAGDSRSSVNEKFISTLKLLTKLFDFFNMVSDRRHEQVLGIIQKIKLIPLDSSEVNSYIGTFHMVPEEVL